MLGGLVVSRTSRTVRRVGEYKVHQLWNQFSRLRMALLHQLPEFNTGIIAHLNRLDADLASSGSYSEHPSIKIFTQTIFVLHF